MTRAKASQRRYLKTVHWDTRNQLQRVPPLMSVQQGSWLEPVHLNALHSHRRKAMHQHMGNAPQRVPLMPVQQG